MSSLAASDTGDSRTPVAGSLTRSGSAFLDCVRFGTAMVVFLGHVSFVPSLVGLTHVAHIAVCVFFVLSGFVIRMVVVTRETTRREFLIDRASRIYSVVLPALLVTFVCAAAARRVDSPFALGYRWADVPVQLLANVTFMAENWGHDVVPMGNSVFWSLSFECVYYVLFALLYAGFRRRSMLASPATLFAVLLMIVVGPAILLLFPTWLAGVLLYDVYQWLRRQAHGALAATLLLVGTSAALIVWRQPLHRLLVDTDFPHRTAWMQRHVGPRFADVGDGTARWLAHFSPSFFLAAGVSFVVMLWALVMLDRFLPDLSLKFTRRLRWVAEGTFALYLLHLPLLVVLEAVFRGRPPMPAIWICLVALVCILLSRGFDFLKIMMRMWLRRVFPEHAKPATGAAARP